MLAVLLILFAGAMLAAGIFYSRVTADLPSLEELPVLLNPVDGELLQPTRITDRSGETILQTLENPGIPRAYLAVNPETADHINPQLVRTVVAKLEPNFWQSSGISTKEWLNPQPSTIAERLASELLLWREPESAARAVRMRILASQLVSTYGRTQVLEWYLNSAYFGQDAFGAESASLLYFNKHAKDLSLGEATMLTVLIDSPALNPIDTPAAALELQRAFLVEIAQNLTISTDEFSSALHEELAIQEAPEDPESLAPAFTRRLIQSLEGEFPLRRLERGGLVVRSTLDFDLQSQFHCTAQTQMARLQGYAGSGSALDSTDCPAALLLPTQNFNWTNLKSQASAGVILNPQTGEVLAYLPPTTPDGIAVADSGYQPGSLLSPFAALAGFARGLSPATLEWDTPVNAEDSLQDFSNPDGVWHGATNIRASIANDYIFPIARVARQVGSANAWQLASLLGLSSLDPSAETEELLFGGGSTSLFEISTAYAALANSGTRSGVLDSASAEIKPNFALSVRSTSNRLILDRSIVDSSPVLSEPLSYMINHILSDESARWPSLGFPNPLEIGQTVAAKIGVISSGQQVWTVGYTPQRLVLVWMGNVIENEAAPRLDPRMAAGIWHAMMKQSLKNVHSSGWTMPEGVTSLDVCFPSGMLPSTACPTTIKEIFLTGNEPTRADTLYEKIMVNRETGQRATVFTNPTLVEEQLFMNVPAESSQWALDAGLPVAPSGYDAIPITQSDPDVAIITPALFSPVSGKVSVVGTAAGDGFSSYSLQIGEGINPAAWIQIAEGTSPNSGKELALWDTSNLDGLYAIRLTVVNTDKTVRSNTIQVTVDNTSPLVSINYPVVDQEIKAPGETVTLLADIEDSSGIAKVEWMLDGKLAFTQKEGPWLYLMPAVTGEHTLQLVAADKAGNTTKTNSIEFVINK